VIRSLDPTPRAEVLLRRRVEKARADGYDFTVDESVEGILGVAVPVGGGDDLGALSVAGPAGRLSVEMLPELVGRMQGAARVLTGAGLRPGAVRLS
jgi:IclR family acetate operon transcriptional repressor